MNDLMRPALYDAWHDILPVRQESGATTEYEIVGPVCESGDFLGHARPLAVAEGDLLAVLDVQSTVRNAFSAADRKLVTNLATQIATAMHDVSRNEQLSSTQKAVDARTMLINTTVAMHRWGHRIHNQAQNIKEAVGLIKRDPAQLDRRLNTIARLAADIQRKPVKEPLHAEKGVDLWPVNALLQDKVQQVMADWPVENRPTPVDVSWRLEAADVDHVAVNPDYFEQVVETILDNAERYGRDQGRLHIVVGTCRVGQQVEISFADDGPGISPDVLAQLSEGPVEADPDKPGMGIALYLARLIMDTYRGRIRYEATAPRGAIVTLAFPLKPPPAGAVEGGIR